MPQPMGDETGDDVIKAQNRFMTSTWHADEAYRQPSKPMHYTVWQVMYKGHQDGVVQTGKIGIYGVWEQSLSCSASFSNPSNFCPRLIAYH